MITNDAPETSPAASAGEFPIPAAALAIDGAKPAEGDEVEFTVKGKVTSIDGENIMVAPTAINDQPLGAAEAKPADMSDDDMMSAAKEADDSHDGY